MLIAQIDKTIAYLRTLSFEESFHLTREIAKPAIPTMIPKGAVTP